MKKLILALALVFIMILGCTAFAAAEDTHEHDWHLVILPNAYLHQYICTICNQIESENHWEYCTNPGVCGGCGKTIEDDDIVINTRYHVWDSYSYNETEHWHHCEACGNDYHVGTHIGYWCDQGETHCYICNAKKSDGAEIKMYDHLANSDEPMQVEKTTHTFTCVVCGEDVTENHYSDCPNVDVCRICRATKDDGIEINWSYSHSWDGYTCSETGHWNHCGRCGNDYNWEAHWANCDAPDVCATCGKTVADGIVIDEVYHDWDGYEYDLQEHWFLCKECGNEYNRAKHQASCTNPGVCAECGVKAADGYQFLDELAHDFDWDHPVYDKTYHWYVCIDCKAETEHWVHGIHCTASSFDHCEYCDASTEAGDTITIWHEGIEEQWLYDENEHWQFCPDCGKNVNREAHDFNNENVCTICEYKKSTQPAEAQYTLSNVTYDGQEIKGKIIRSDGAAISKNVQVRVTFYLEGNIYMGTYCEVDENGEFSADGVGLIQYITVLALEEEKGAVNRLDAAELFI